MTLKNINKMDIFEQYKNDPYFELKVGLSGGFTLFVKWNTFLDKKDEYKAVMRTRYILFDKDNKRQSLKILNLKEKVEFKQIFLDDNLIKLIKSTDEEVQKEILLYSMFGHWIDSDFTKMINSGDFQIISFENI
jgi:hypothetical protein